MFYFPQALEPKMNFVAWNWTINIIEESVYYQVFLNFSFVCLFTIVNNCQWNYSVLFLAIKIYKRCQSFWQVQSTYFWKPSDGFTSNCMTSNTFKSVNQNVNPGMVSPFNLYQRMTCQHLHNFSLFYNCLIKHKRYDHRR